MIKLNAISKSFGETIVYKDLTLTFEAGHSYALVGKSGTGKSTLLNALARFEKPDSGQILLDGKDIWKMKEQTYFREELGYIFQNYALVEDESVWQNLSFLAKRREVLEALSQVGLDQTFLSKKIFELSGGQAQRIAIARLLLKKSRVILADEPTGALDRETGQTIIDLLLTLATKNRVVIFATHDPEVFQRVDHVIDMGEITS